MTAVRRRVALTALAAGQGSSAVKALVALAAAGLVLTFNPAQAQPKAAPAASTPAAEREPIKPAAPGQKVLRYAFNAGETGFDPARIVDLYSRIVTTHIFEALYTYDHLARPAKIKPLIADGMPEHSPDFRTWTVRVKKGIYFADDPAFKGKKRELVAEDYVYALKRHATTRIAAPIFSTFAEYVVGLKDYGELIRREDKLLRAGLDPASLDKPFLDFRQWPLAGASAPEKHLLRVRIKGKYPQWNYWMQMTFMAPVPWEADAFYAQPGMAAVGLSPGNSSVS